MFSIGYCKRALDKQHSALVDHKCDSSDKHGGDIIVSVR